MNVKRNIYIKQSFPLVNIKIVSKVNFLNDMLSKYDNNLYGLLDFIKLNN